MSISVANWLPVRADTFDRVFSELKAAGTRVLPILYNDESGQKTLLSKLRRLFASPSAQKQLIGQMVQLAVSHDLDGWNLDFETDEPVTAQDAASLASFVDNLANALHAHQKVLSIDLDSWRQEDNPFWKHQPLYNHSLLNATALDKAITMSTYER